MIPHQNIHKYTWTSPDGKIHNHIDHILLGDGIRVYSMYDISGELPVILTDRYLVVPKVREKLAVSKQAARKFDVEWFYLRKLSELEIMKQYQIKISNRFAALENLNDGVDIKRACEITEENIKTSAKSLN